MGWEGRGDRGEHVAGGCSPDPTWIGLLGGLMGGFAGGVGALSTPKPGGSALLVLGAGWKRRKELGEHRDWPGWAKQHLGGSWAQSRD